MRGAIDENYRCWASTFEGGAWVNGNKVRAAGAMMASVAQGLGCPRNGKHIGIHPGSGRRAIDARASH